MATTRLPAATWQTQNSRVRAGTVRDILTHLAKGASTFSCGRGVSYCNEKPACKL